MSCVSSLAEQWASARLNPLTRAVEDCRRGGIEFLDLTAADAAEHGRFFPARRLGELAGQTLAQIAAYQPDPRGRLSARQAIAAYYHRRGADADPERILLTPGTSLAYFYLLRLLAEAGDAVLIPRPGYPLFDDLCALCGIERRCYHLECADGVWSFDLNELAFQCNPQVRAIIAVSPHNPTGAVCSAEDLRGLGALCRERNLALVFDEVFSEFTAPAIARHCAVARSQSRDGVSTDQSGAEAAAESFVPLPRPRTGEFPLCVTLNGCSKMFALPGWKIGWMKVDGEALRVAPFLRALEHLSDTFLPVPDLQQAMIPGLFAAGDPAVSAALAREYAARRALALELLQSPATAYATQPKVAASAIKPDAFLSLHEATEVKAGPDVHAPTLRAAAPAAGVYLCCALPDDIDDEAFALHALRRHNVLVHPGYFYDLPGHVVLNCMAPADTLRAALPRLMRAAADYVTNKKL